MKELMDVLTKKPVISLMIGRPNSGKTQALRFLMYNLAIRGHYRYGIAFSPTAHISGDLSHLPKRVVIRRYSEEYLERYVTAISDWAESTGKKPPNSFIILDDCLGAINWYSPFISNLLSVHRHLGLSIFVCSQYTAGFGSSPLLRECLSVAFLWPTNYAKSLKHFYDLCGSICKDRDEFERLFHQVTSSEPHTALLYLNGHDTPEKCYYHFRASIAPAFQIKF